MRRLIIALTVATPLLAGCIIVTERAPDEARAVAQTPQ